MRIVLLFTFALFSCGVSSDVEPRVSARKVAPKSELPQKIQVGNDGLEAAVWVTAGAYAMTSRVFRKVQEFQDESKVPNVDRWDPVILAAAKGKKQVFLFTKTFIHVESRGNPYVVSPTGCAGLMQFCIETAKGKEYRLVFNTKEIHRCRCRTGRCSVSRNTSKELELDILDKVEFPCNRDDPRFDPERSIEAGALFVDKLRRRYRGNLYMMYVGYNSGPSLADEVFRSLAKNGRVTPKQIEPHLRSVLVRHYGTRRGNARADALVNIQFRKLKRTYNTYLHQPIFDELSPESLSQWAL